MESNDSLHFYINILNKVAEHYYGPLQKYLESHPELISTYPAFLLQQERIVLYLGRTHLAIEYYGRELTNKLPTDKIVPLSIFDYTASDNNFFEDVVGFKYESSAGKFKMPLPPFAEDLLFPTNAGMDKLLELKWNFDAQNSIMGINSPAFEVPKNQFCRIVNGRFFDADENGLKSRHIKWMDFLPLEITLDTDTEHAFNIRLTELTQLMEHDAHYTYPLPYKNDYKYTKLPQINRFIEIIGDSASIETDLTSFLEQPENKFILTMAFSSVQIHAQLTCEWQNDTKAAIKPDFFLSRANGFSDIVEFKLPKPKGSTVVGKENRESFSAELHSYIAQTRTYKTYFEDTMNREWVKDKHGIKVRYPKRILVVGRRWDFSHEIWKELQEDYRDIEIVTYDDLLDTVVAQFYT